MHYSSLQKDSDNLSFEAFDIVLQCGWKTRMFVQWRMSFEVLVRKTSGIRWNAGVRTVLLIPMRLG